MERTVPSRERLDLGRMVNYGHHRHDAIHRWYCFRHSFSKDLVKELVQAFGLKQEAHILDPFCGSGTTLVAAQELGMKAEGVDRLPFSVFVSNVKVSSYLSEEIRRGLMSLEFRGAQESQQVWLETPLFQKAFSPEVFSNIIGLRDEILSLAEPQPVKDFLLLAWYSILEDCSYTRKDGAFLRIVAKNITPDMVRASFTERVNTMLSDVVHGHRSYARAFIGDSRSLPEAMKLAPYDAIITSPPYPNRHDYTRIYALELLLGTVPSNEDLKTLRYSTLRSHVEARPFSPRPTQYEEPRLLLEVAHGLDRKGYPARNRDMLFGYFEDMFLVLLQLHAVSKRQAKVALVVSDVRFGGITIPVTDILTELGAETGFSVEDRWILRYRGNTPQQLKSHPMDRTEESVLILART